MLEEFLRMSEEDEENILKSYTRFCRHFTQLQMSLGRHQLLLFGIFSKYLDDNII